MMLLHRLYSDHYTPQADAPTIADFNSALSDLAKAVYEEVSKESLHTAAASALIALSHHGLDEGTEGRGEKEINQSDVAEFFDNCAVDDDFGSPDENELGKNEYDPNDSMLKKVQEGDSPSQNANSQEIGMFYLCS
jgi:hypothetical protein